MLLQVEGLRVTYPVSRGWPVPRTSYLRAVDDVSLNVGAGEALGIVGESGCGKSTVARAILRLARADEGRVVFDGVDVTRLPLRALRKLRPRMQMIFQDPAASLSPRMRIGDALAEAIAVHGITHGGDARRLIKETLSDVGLPPEAAARYPHEFSGGQKQRIGIARALVLSPSLIIADEPTSALDVTVRRQVLSVLDELIERRDASLVFISHDLNLVADFCDRVLVMYAGQVLEDLPASRLREAEHPYTRGLLESLPRLDRKVETLAVPVRDPAWLDSPVLGGGAT